LANSERPNISALYTAFVGEEIWQHPNDPNFWQKFGTSAGAIRRQTTVVTLLYKAFAAGGASTSKIVYFLTIPPKTRVVSVIAEVTQAFVGVGLSAITLDVSKSATPPTQMAI
jgi:hypothetical protein